MQNPPTDQPGYGDEQERAADLAQLKDRLAFYESFDKLIQENVSRAGELLREAAARRSEGDLALRNSTAELEKRQLEERSTYRRLFAGFLDQIQTVQQNVERLAREVSDALDDLESVLPAAGELAADGDEFPPLPTFQGSTSGSLASGLMGRADEPNQAQLEPSDELFAGEAPETEPRTGVGTSAHFAESIQASVDRVSQSYEVPAEPIAEAASADTTDDAEAGAEIEEEGASSFEPWATPDPETEAEASEAPGSYPFVGEEADSDADATEEESVEGTWDVADVAPVVDADDTASNGTSDIDPGDEADSTGAIATTTLLVHGVPRATTALSLKRFLEAMPHVHSVEPREYAEGVLRLQVASEHPIGLADLEGWPEASGLEPMTVEQDFVEVRLPQ